MRRSRGFVHPVARRVALASMTVLATSGIGTVSYTHLTLPTTERV